MAQGIDALFALAPARFLLAPRFNAPPESEKTYPTRPLPAAWLHLATRSLRWGAQGNSSPDSSSIEAALADVLILAYHDQRGAGSSRSAAGIPILA